MSTENNLLNFDKTLENVKRQITAVVPTRNIYPEARKGWIAEQVKEGEREPTKVLPAPKPKSIFELEGVSGLIERQEDALLVAASFARYRFSVKNAYLSDLGAGLYSMATQRETGLYGLEELQSKDLKTGVVSKTGLRLVCSRETLKKALLGPLVDDNGRACRGTGPIVESAWEAVAPILSGDVAMPRAYASVNRTAKDGTPLNALIEGEPIRVYRRKTAGGEEVYAVDLDYFFFPAIERDSGGLITNDQYLHQVAGLTSFLQLGAKISRGGEKAGSVDVTTARKIILSAQAAFELRYFAPGIVRENASNRINIALRRTAVSDLYSPAVNSKTGFTNFKAFSNAVALSGEYFNSAINATGIRDALVKQGKVIIPANDKGAEFPPDYPTMVFIKADRL